MTHSGQVKLGVVPLRQTDQCVVRHGPTIPTRSSHEHYILAGRSYSTMLATVFLERWHLCIFCLAQSALFNTGYQLNHLEQRPL